MNRPHLEKDPIICGLPATDNREEGGGRVGRRHWNDTMSSTGGGKDGVRISDGEKVRRGMKAHQCHCLGNSCPFDMESRQADSTQADE